MSAKRRTLRVKGAIFTFSSSFLPFLTFLLLRIACMVRDPSLELATPLSFSLSSSSSQFYSAERFLHRTVRGRGGIHVFHIPEKLNFRQKRDRAKSWFTPVLCHSKVNRAFKPFLQLHDINIGDNSLATGFLSLWRFVKREERARIRFGIKENQKWEVTYI